MELDLWHISRNSDEWQIRLVRCISGLLLVFVPMALHSANRFSWRIIIPVSSVAWGRKGAGVYLPLSKIILIHNPFQMSYWLREASLPLSIRSFYIQRWSPNTCLQESVREDGDICKIQAFRRWNPPLTATLKHQRFCSGRKPVGMFNKVFFFFTKCCFTFRTGSVVCFCSEAHTHNPLYLGCRRRLCFGQNAPESARGTETKFLTFLKIFFLNKIRRRLCLQLWGCT